MTTIFRDRRRKHQHYRATIIYKDGKQFERIYTDELKAQKFAERQKRSPIVETAKVNEVN